MASKLLRLAAAGLVGFALLVAALASLLPGPAVRRRTKALAHVRRQQLSGALPPPRNATLPRCPAEEPPPAEDTSAGGSSLSRPRRATVTLAPHKRPSRW